MHARLGSLVVLLPLMIGGCFLFNSSASQAPEPEASAPAPAEPQRSATEIYSERIDPLEQAYARMPEGNATRLMVLDSINLAYVEFQANYAATEPDAPIAAWEASIADKLAAERAWYEAAVAAHEGPMPAQSRDRPTDGLRVVHGIYVRFLVAKGEPAEVVAPHLVATLSVDRAHDPGETVYPPDQAALAAFEASYGRAPTQAACRAAVDALPKQAKSQRLLVMYICEISHYDRWREDLSMWASAAEVKAFASSYGAAIDADIANYAARAERERAEREAAAQAANADPGGSPAAGAPVSVTLRNTCSSTVKVFYGDDPKFGSGKHSSLSGNSRQSAQMRPGEMIWLTDDSGNGLASATVSSNTGEITVTCNGMSSN